MGQEESLVEGMEIHCCILAWEIPWTEEPGRPQSIGSRRVTHDWSNLVRMHPSLHNFKLIKAHQLFPCNPFIPNKGKFGGKTISAYMRMPVCVHVYIKYMFAAKSRQSCLTLCDPTDGSPPGSPIPGILQARIPEWVAISYSRGSSWPRDGTLISYISCIGRWVLYH